MKVPGRDTVDGIDVSRWQGDVNWDAFNLDFAIIKASGGDGGLYVDPEFRDNARWPRPWGAYHFCSGVGDPVREARFFVDTIIGRPWVLPPVADWEVGWANDRAGQLRANAWLFPFLEEIEHQLDVVPMIYTGAFVALDRSDRRLLRHPLWLAAYTGQPIPCSPWPTWAAWQYSSTGHVPGIVGNVDMNLMDRAFFESHGATASAITPPPGTPAPASEEDDDMITVLLADLPPNTAWGNSLGDASIPGIAGGAQFAVAGDNELRWCSGEDVAQLKADAAKGYIKLQIIGQQPEDFFSSRTLKGRVRPDGAVAS